MNKKNVGASTDFTHFLLDLLLICISFTITIFVYWDRMDLNGMIDYSILGLVFIIIFMVSNKEKRIYNVTMFYYLDRVYKRVMGSFMTAAIVTSAILYYMAQKSVPREVYFTFLVISFVLIAINVFIFHRFFNKFLKKKNLPRVVYVGKKSGFEKFRYFLNKTSILFEEVGYIWIDDEAIMALEKNSDSSKDDDSDIYTSECPEGYIGKLSELDRLVREYNIDQIYILQKKDIELDYIQKYIDLCMEMGITCRVIVDFFKRRRANSYVSAVGTYPVITYHTICLNNLDAAIKRAVDILGALVGIILSSPIMLITAIAIKIDSPGPVIFKQVRVGQNGRHFSIYKFRSMYIDAEARKAELMSQNEIEGGVMFKMKDDPRVTRVGKFIRKTSIDELPQFFNVFLGSMSLVGTRPPTVDEVEKYETGQWRRISIKPGITGMWQVNGRSNVETFEEIVQMDVDYIDNWSIFEDIKILFKTVLVLLHRDGAY